MIILGTNSCANGVDGKMVIAKRKKIEMMPDEGLFSFGNYGWLSNYRQTAILNRARIPKASLLRQKHLGIDIFNSCYLLNTHQKRELTPTEKSIIEPILLNKKIRYQTIGDDMMARAFSVVYAEKIEKAYQQAKQKMIQRLEQQKKKEEEQKKKENKGKGQGQDQKQEQKDKQDQQQDGQNQGTPIDGQDQEGNQQGQGQCPSPDQQGQNGQNQTGQGQCQNPGQDQGQQGQGQGQPDQGKNPGQGDSPPKPEGPNLDLDQEGLDDMENQLKQDMREVQEDIEDMRQMRDVVTKSAGKQFAKLALDQAISIKKQLDLKKLLKILEKFEVELAKKGEGEYGDFRNVGAGRDLNKVLITEMAKDDELFYLDYARGTLLTQEFEEGGWEEFVILMDSSGSMSGSKKLTFSRSLAFCLALRAKKEHKDCKIVYFNTRLATKIYSLKEDSEMFLKAVLHLRADGGTSIGECIKQLQREIGIEKAPKTKVFVVTDGEDSFYLSKNEIKFKKLYAVFVEGSNSDLSNIADKSFTINDSVGKITLKT